MNIFFLVSNKSVRYFGLVIILYGEVVLSNQIW